LIEHLKEMDGEIRQRSEVQTYLGRIDLSWRKNRRWRSVKSSRRGTFVERKWRKISGRGRFVRERKWRKRRQRWDEKLRTPVAGEKTTKRRQ
jgi:hypothetical protein